MITYYVKVYYNSNLFSTRYFSFFYLDINLVNLSPLSYIKSRIQFLWENGDWPRCWLSRAWNKSLPEFVPKVSHFLFISGFSQSFMEYTICKFFGLKKQSDIKILVHLDLESNELKIQSYLRCYKNSIVFIKIESQDSSSILWSDDD